MALYENYDAFIFDCDGVLYTGNIPITGAADTIKKLLSLNKQVFFVTNNSTKTKRTLMEYLRNVLGSDLNISPNTLYTSGTAAAYYIKKRLSNTGDKVFLIGSKGFSEILDENEIEYVGYGEMKTMLWLDFEDYEYDPSVKFVVGGFDPHLTHTKLTQAYLHIKEGGAQYIASNVDMIYPLTATRTLPGTGSVLAGLSSSLGYDPLVIGKPSQVFYDIICEEHNLPCKSKVLMVGDNLMTDIKFGENVGIDSALVLTGVTKRDMLKNNDISTPTYVLDSILNLFSS